MRSLDLLLYCLLGSGRLGFSGAGNLPRLVGSSSSRTGSQGVTLRGPIA